MTGEKGILHYVKIAQWTAVVYFIINNCAF